MKKIFKVGDKVWVVIDGIVVRQHVYSVTEQMNRNGQENLRFYRTKNTEASFPDEYGEYLFRRDVGELFETKEELLNSIKENI